MNSAEEPSVYCFREENGDRGFPQNTGIHATSNARRL
jgi:hypothetical protein